MHLKTLYAPTSRRVCDVMDVLDVRRTGLFRLTVAGSFRISGCALEGDFTKLRPGTNPVKAGRDMGYRDIIIRVILGQWKRKWKLLCSI